MRVRSFDESDVWSHEGPNIKSPENLQIIKNTLNSKGSIIIEHWHDCGATCPSRFIFNKHDVFLTHPNDECHAGDIVDLWAMGASESATHFLLLTAAQWLEEVPGIAPMQCPYCGGRLQSDELRGPRCVIRCGAAGDCPPNLPTARDHERHDGRHPLEHHLPVQPRSHS